MINNTSKKQQSAGKIIGELSRAAHIFFQHQFKDYSIGHAQVRTLHYLSHNNGITQVALTEYLNLDKSSVTSQLNNLEKNGYIYRSRSPEDARIRTINITDKAKEIFGSLMNVFSSWTDILLTNFSEKEKEDIFLLLNKMHENSQTKINELKLDEKKK